MKSKLILIISVLSLSLSSVNAQDKVARLPKLNYDWREGFVNITELTGGAGLNLTYAPLSQGYFGITTVNGYQFSRNIKAGIGIGAHIYEEGVLLPLFIDARFSLSAQEFVPFISAAGGVELSLDDFNGTSRIFINPALGVKWVAASRLGVSFSTGLIVMSGGGEGGRSSFINFKLGIEFKGK